MNLATSVLIALAVWMCLAWACGLVVGSMIELMQREEEPDERRPRLPI